MLALSRTKCVIDNVFSLLYGNPMTWKQEFDEIERQLKAKRRLLTKYAVAERAGVDKSAIVRWRAGKTAPTANSFDAYKEAAYELLREVDRLREPPDET